MGASLQHAGGGDVGGGLREGNAAVVPRVVRRRAGHALQRAAKVAAPAVAAPAVAAALVAALPCAGQI